MTRLKYSSLRSVMIILVFSSTCLISVTTPLGLNPFEIILCCAFAILIISSLAGGYSLTVKRTPLVLNFFVLLVLLTLSMLWHAKFTPLLTLIFATSIYLYVILNKDISRNSIIYSVFISGLVVAISSIGQRLGVVPEFSFSKISSFRDSEIDGYTGLISNRGNYGIYILSGMSMALILIFRTSGIWFRVFLFTALMLFLYAAFLSQSRSTIIASTTTLISFLIFRFATVRLRFGNTSRQLAAAPFLFIVFTCVFSYAVASGIVHRFVNWLIGIRSASVESRIETILYSLELLRGNLVWGVGPKISEALEHTIHNAYVAILSEHGLFSLLAFVSLNLVFLRGLLRGIWTPIAAQRTECIALLACFIGAQVELFFFRGFYSIALWAHYALLFVFLEERKATTFPNRAKSIQVGQFSK